MNYKLTIISKENGTEITDGDLLMSLADIDTGCHFSGVGMDNEGIPLVFDKCGHYGELDWEKYQVVICMGN